MIRLFKRHVYLVLLIAAVGSGWYSYSNRYYLRFVPLPLAAIDIINKDTWLSPSFEPSKPLGNYDIGAFDLTTEDGLRNTLNRIQNLSPSKNVNGMPSYVDATFDKWIAEVTSKPIYCTDGSLLLILAANQQGLRAREWHLLPPGWPPGLGHSVVEIFNPRTDRWQLVDGQHAAIIRDGAGQILDMTSVLKSYAENGRNNIKVDYGPYEHQMLNGMRGPSTEHYFFAANLLSTPVLQLRQATWFSSVARNFGLTGHFVIGYPIIVNNWSHDIRVLSSKIAAMGMVLFGVLFIWTAYRRYGQFH